jgi:hypothetical protein
MTADTDEDALSWKGDADPSLVTGTAPSTLKAPKPDAVRTKSANGEEPEPDEKPRTSSFLLVSYGILAGAYLIYTVGWIVAIVKSDPVQTGSVLVNLMTIAGEYTAIASGALWFAGIFLLTRKSRAVVRLLWLLLGLVLLIPWPFVLVGVK